MSTNPIPVQPPVRRALEPADAFFSPDADGPLSFVELVLTACECSDDAGEIADIVDVLFERNRFQLRHLREEQLAIA